MNKIIRILRDGMVSSIISGEATTGIVPAGSDILVAVPMDANKFMLTSLDVTANKEIDFFVEVFENPNKLKSYYNSGIVRGRNYDLLDMIYVDEKGSEQCYINITNQSPYDTEFTISVRGYLMK